MMKERDRDVLEHKKMRNIAAHHYGKFNMEILYDTITNDIPQLKKYCLELLERE